MIDKPEVAKPFSNGSEYHEWRDNNCDLCKLGFDDTKGNYKCKYERALDHAYFGDGCVRVDYLEVMGLHEDGSGNCSNYQAWDGVLRRGTVEYEMQRKLDEAMLAAWTKGA
jgi:hypothetical protein